MRHRDQFKRRGVVLCMTTLLCLALALSFSAQERGDVKAPVQRVLTVTSYEIVGLEIFRLPDWRLAIRYTDNLGTLYLDEHIGLTDATNPSGAEALIVALNKANLTQKSLERRLLEHLIAEGRIPDAAIIGDPR